MDARDQNARKNVMKFRNKYYIMRHGQAISNIRDVVSCWPEKFKNPLTKTGIAAIKESAKKLDDKNINLIFASPLLRTKQTAEIVGKRLKIKVKLDKRLREIDFGVFNSKPVDDVWNFFNGEKERIKKNMPKGEKYPEILKRMYDFIKSTDKKYKGKNILVVSHEGTLFLLEGKLKGFSLEKTIEEYPFEKRIHKGEIREIN